MDKTFVTFALSAGQEIS